MINITSSSSNRSCRQAKNWLEKHELKFNEININNRLYEDGTSQVLSQRKMLSPELTYILEILEILELVLTFYGLHFF